MNTTPYTAEELAALVEISPPSVDRWVKNVSAVAERAKDGKGWEGDWLQKDGRVQDARVGDLIAWCFFSGSRKNGSDKVRLGVVFPSGQCRKFAEHHGKDWGYELREEAREMLARPVHERLAYVAEIMLGDEEETLAKAQAALAEMPALLAAAQAELATYSPEACRPVQNEILRRKDSYIGGPNRPTPDVVALRLEESYAEVLAARTQAVAKAEENVVSWRNIIARCDRTASLLAADPCAIEIGAERPEMAAARAALAALLPAEREELYREFAGLPV